MITPNKKLKIAYKLSNILNCELFHLAKLSAEQIDYVYRGLRESTYLQACPGSGKTEVIGIKSAYEISKWTNKNGGVAVLTFTNSAAKELGNRVEKFQKPKSNGRLHFIGTFDSWLHNFLLHPFCHYMTKFKGKDGDKSIRIIESDSGADFMHSFEIKIDYSGKLIPVSAAEYSYKFDWNNLIGETKITKSIFANSLTETNRKKLIELKSNFYKAGFATYSDAEFLCLKLLKNYPHLLKKLALRFPAFIIDECQDLSEIQISILNKIKEAGANIDFVGDMNQAIYDFRDVDPNILIKYIEDNGLRKLLLTNNYRSNQEVVNLSCNLIGGGIKIATNVATLCNVPCLLWHYDETYFMDLPKKFEDLVGLNKLSVGRCAILARGKSTLEPFRVQHQKSGYAKIQLFALSIHCWCKSDKSTDDLKIALAYAGKFVFQIAYAGRPDVKNQFCPDFFNATSWRLLLMNFLNAAKILYPFESGGKEICWREWAQLVKVFLKTNWSLFDLSQQEVSNGLRKIMAPKKKGR